MKIIHGCTEVIKESFLRICRSRFIAITGLIICTGVWKANAQSPIVVETIADLRALNTTSFTNTNPEIVALVIDYYAPYANGLSSYALHGRGGGHFRWEPGVMLADDGGRFITNTIGNGTWERMLQGELPNVKMWGAVGDGITNDFLSISNAIYACQNWSCGSLLFPCGTYLVTNTLVFNGAQLAIHGEGLASQVIMATNIQKDIFQTWNAYQALTGGYIDLDHHLIFEDMYLGYAGTSTTCNTNNACLVVCQPGEGHVIRNVQTEYGGIGIRCLGAGAPGLRVRDCTVSDAAIAGICIEPLPGQSGGIGDPVSLLGVSGDMRSDTAAATASLVLFSNTIPGGRITEIKAEGDFGGGVIQCIYPPSSYLSVFDMSDLIVENCSYNAGVTDGSLWFPPDFVVLRGSRGAPVTLSGLQLFAVNNLINDYSYGRGVQAEIDYGTPYAQNTAHLPVNYQSTAPASPWPGYSRLVVGQTAMSYLYATNSGWYRVMMPKSVGYNHIAGKLVISAIGYESTEIQIDVNPYSGNPAGAWLNVTRCMGTNGYVPPVVTQARGFYYYDSTLSGDWCYVDIFVGNPIPASSGLMSRLKLAYDINGYENYDDLAIDLIGTPYAVSATLPSGAVSTVVNTYR